ncbi:hypothetical protein H7347_04370 [Corynebacterium sp. zg-331]|uniref:hypothetical protein n=1 Tax=unclassified Corynebacterium TaxID=2624378 RepID=UPI00128C350E|nr:MULTISPECIES: hypothetical protein [unclassified Corynebacterium]MBC3185814.1 hypothetical protein [Corynebacterium sp. zg-331]MPV52306.1 hypothetical protein [Corynebacterium sp. zg331]
MSTTTILLDINLGIPRVNSHGYLDSTALKALKQVQRDEFAYRPPVYLCSPYYGDIEANVRLP